MSKITRVVVLAIGVMSIFAALASAASASWTNSGSTAFTATTGPGTLTAGGASLSCTSGSATGVAPASSAGSTYTVTGTIGYPTCRLSIFNTSVSCTYTLTGTRITGSVTDGTAAVSCRDSALGCSITGAIPGRYTNATGSTPGSLSVNGSTGLTSTGCILSGSATLLPNPTVFTVTNGLPSGTRGPILSQP